MKPGCLFAAAALAWTVAGPAKPVLAMGSRPAPSAPPSSAAPATVPAPAAPLDVQPRAKGMFSLNGIGVSLMHKSGGWVPAYLRDLVPDEGFPKSEGAAWVTRGSLKTGAGVYRVEQTVNRRDPVAAEYRAVFAGVPAADTRVLYLSLGLPAAVYKGQKIVIDRDDCALPWWFRELGLLRAMRPASMLRIPLQHGGTLVVEGRFDFFAQDNRTFGNEAYDLQIFFTPHEGKIENANLDLTFRVVPDTDPLAVPYDAKARRPTTPAGAKPRPFTPDAAAIAAALRQVGPLPPLRPAGGVFADPSGRAVRFWGMNLVAFYPDHALADRTADNLAALGINLVRPHHNLRPSRDWCPADCCALMTYEKDSRTPNPAAWDSFDYLNARLRGKGIYLALSLHGTRQYLPDDNAVLRVSPEDDEAWADAMGELNGWNWRKAFDPRKMLPLIDERCFLLNAEFARALLTHVNPYTGLAYGKDPQVLSLELVNEFSSEYNLLCGNRFPAYWARRLDARFREFSKARGLPPFDLYAPKKTPAQQDCFSAFCRSLDETYARRMTAVIRGAGCDAPVEFSNLWRGDASLGVRAETDGVIEDHAYEDPLVVADSGAFGRDLAKSAVAGKPFIIGEFNQSENPKLLARRQSVRTMMVPAIAAYSSLQDWSGVVWFAWCHGARNLGPDGWGAKLASREGSIGDLAGDGPVLDHLRTAGLIFRNGYLSPSAKPVTIPLDASSSAGSYESMMAGRRPVQPGWQAVHAFRKTFGPAPAVPADAPWFKAPPPDPTVSDTGQIVRNAQRRQLTFAAPKAEGFSGYLDDAPPDRLAVLNVAGGAGFATVLVVTLDGAPLAQSGHILLSRTAVDATGKETAEAGQVALRGLGRSAWSMTVTRPAKDAPPPAVLAADADGTLRLPPGTWHECELTGR